MALRLVSHGKPRRLSGAEISALTAERVAKREEEREAARAALKADRDAWLAGNAKRLRLMQTGSMILAGLVVVGAVYCMTLEERAALGMALSLVLFGVALWVALGVWSK